MNCSNRSRCPKYAQSLNNSMIALETLKPTRTDTKGLIMHDLTLYPLIARIAQTNRYEHDYQIARHIAPMLSIFSNADAFRNLLIDPDCAYDDATDADDTLSLNHDAFAECTEYLHYALNDANEYFTEQITEFALQLSLCPLHRIDYAICFDDNDAECAQIRAIHPSHDT